MIQSTRSQWCETRDRDLYLNRSIPFASDLQLDPLPTFIQRDLAFLDRNHRTRHLLVLILTRIDEGESIFRRDRQKAAIQRLLQIPIVRANGMVDSHQISTSLERALDLQFCQRRYD